MIRISRIRSARKEELKDINRLLPQLTRNPKPLSMKQYRDILVDKNNFVFVARDGQRVMGMATLVLMRTPTALRSWMEDVVVDTGYRGQGVGMRLCKAILAEARKLKAENVKLTSRPARSAANNLYRKMGFKRKITNVYKMDLK